MQNSKIIQHFPTLMLVSRRALRVLGTLMALTTLALVILAIVVNRSSDPSAEADGLVEFVGWGNAALSLTWIALAAALCFVTAGFFEYLRCLGVQISQSDLQTPKSITILNKLGRRSLELFALEVVGYAVQYLSPFAPGRNPQPESFGWSLVTDVLSLLPGLSGGGLLIGALLFYILRDSITASLELTRKNKELQVEVDLTV